MGKAQARFPVPGPPAIGTQGSQDLQAVPVRRRAPRKVPVVSELVSVPLWALGVASVIVGAAIMILATWIKTLIDRWRS